MNSQTKVCQNCHNEFVIEPDDFSFYEKMKVPPPTWCPECRLQRKLLFRNERTLYKHKCEKCGKDLISIYHNESPMTVYCRDCWFSDAWDPLMYGKKVDFSQSFLSQFKDLFRAVPIMNLWAPQSVNSEYCNFIGKSKDCYLAFGGKEDENIRYSNMSSFSKDSQDLLNCNYLEFSYENIQCENSQKLFFSKYSNNCSNSYFLYECRNCVDCFGCANLRNKQNCFFNEQLTKEEYKKKLQEVDLGSFKNFTHNFEEFNVVYNNAIHKYAQFINTVNCTGDNIRNARDCRACFDISGTDSENSKYVIYAVNGVKDSYGSYGMPRAERIYETIATGFDLMENSDYAFTFFVRGSKNIQYSINCSASHDLFGCVGLDKKEYCILNKQYTKEEYQELLPRIIQHMNEMPYVDKKGRVYKYGEFFPAEFSSFAYNETIAQEYFPLTKAKAEELGFAWKEGDARNYKIDLKSEDLPDHIKDADESIVGKVIECGHKGNCNEQCTTAFKIIPQELQFYKKLNLPLPRLCPNCRHHQRLKQRNPFKIWHRRCQCAGVASENGDYKNADNHFHGDGHCPNEFETAYAPDCKEIVYCEQCYQQEVA